MSLFALDHRSGEAIYSQIRRMIEKEIHEHYRPGDRLPSETALAERFGVNRHTLRRAVDALVASGLLSRRHGLGVYVLEPQVPYSIDREARFTVNLEHLSKPASVRLLHRQVIPVRDLEARQLGLEEGAAAVWVGTLRLVEGKPFSLIDHFLPQAMFPKVAEEYGGGSLHAFLLEQYGVRPRKAGCWISSVRPMGDDALQLQMPDHETMLRVRTLNVDPRDGSPVEYAVSRFRASRVELEMKF